MPCGSQREMCLFVLFMWLLWLNCVLFVVVVIVLSMAEFMEIMEGLAESKDGDGVVVLLSWLCCGCGV